MTTSQGRTWTVVEISVPAGESEELASWLFIHKLGANGCQVGTLDDSGVVSIAATFDSSKLPSDNLEPVISALDEHGLAAVAGTLKVAIQKEEDWLSEWKKGFLPLEIGEKFIISPPWCAGDVAGTSRLVIFIEPGLAFGTGYHATTQFCLESMEVHACGPEILDVGTGSGILAIGVAKLFADARIVAVENDPEACRVARENLELNGVVGRVELVEGSIDDAAFGTAFNTILSNLTCEDNCALLPIYRKILAPEGKIIMSGILTDKLHLIEKCVDENGYKQVEKRINGNWACVIAGL